MQGPITSLSSPALGWFATLGTPVSFTTLPDRLPQIQLTGGSGTGELRITPA